MGMPALGTHVYQSTKCLERLKPELENRGIDVNEVFTGFVGAAAIAHDTLGLLFGTAYERCFVSAHEMNTDAFFLDMIAYIKENNLKENPNAMAFLYGHIMHYALDTSTHPLVYYMTELHPAQCLGSALKAHALFEVWVDMQLEAREADFDKKSPFRTKVSRAKIDALIDAVYEKAHGLQKAAFGYRYGILIWEAYQLLLRRSIMKKMRAHFPDFQAMLNEGRAQFPNPVTGETLDTSFWQAYEASSNLACELITAVNANIFDNADNEEQLRQAFGNSYDTGGPWGDPRPKQYFKQY